jgi:hypothetical protein
VVVGEHLHFAVAARADRFAFLNGLYNVRNPLLSLVVDNRDDALDKFDAGERGR